eukprot:5113099-Amphidinium_carterae.1
MGQRRGVSPVPESVLQENCGLRALVMRVFLVTSHHTAIGSVPCCKVVVVHQASADLQFL